MTTTAPATIDSKKPNTKQELIAASIKLLIELRPFRSASGSFSKGGETPPLASSDRFVHHLISRSQLARPWPLPWRCKLPSRLGFGCCTFRVETRHVHAERHLAKAGVARRAAEVCTSAARKIGDTPCAARSGQSPFHVFCQWLGAGISPCIDGRSLFFEISMG